MLRYNKDLNGQGSEQLKSVCTCLGLGWNHLKSWAVSQLVLQGVYPAYHSPPYTSLPVKDTNNTRGLSTGFVPAGKKQPTEQRKLLKNSWFSYSHLKQLFYTTFSMFTFAGRKTEVLLEEEWLCNPHFSFTRTVWGEQFFIRQIHWGWRFSHLLWWSFTFVGWGKSSVLNSKAFTSVFKHL